MWKNLKSYRNGIAAQIWLTASERLGTFCDNEDGASLIIVGLMLPALVGGMGLAAEVSYWQLHNRAMQNAGDAAAIAAATNGTSYYASVAKGTAARYGFTDGSKNITVTVSNPNTAKGCTSNCYVVTVTDKVPLFLSQVVGYTGSATVNGQTIDISQAGAQPITMLSASGQPLAVPSALGSDGASFSVARTAASATPQATVGRRGVAPTN